MSKKTNPAVTASTEGAKAKPKKAPKKAPKSLPRKNQKISKSPPVREETDLDDKLGPDFSLIHRWTPACKAQAYIMATVNGSPTKRFITNMSVTMSHKFSTIMQNLLEEARQGKFKTRGELINRRNEFLDIQQPAVTADGAAETAVDADTAAVEEGPEHGSGGVDVD